MKRLILLMAVTNTFIFPEGIAAIQQFEKAT